MNLLLMFVFSLTTIVTAYPSHLFIGNEHDWFARLTGTRPDPESVHANSAPIPFQRARVEWS